MSGNNKKYRVTDLKDIKTLYDVTSNEESTETTKTNHIFKRGQIYYIKNPEYSQVTGSEQTPGRPAVIISNDIGNGKSPVLEIVYLTTKEKKPMPTHTSVLVPSTGIVSTSICEQIFTVSKERAVRYLGQCTQKEMDDIDNAILVSIGLSLKARELFSITDELSKKAYSYICHIIDCVKNIQEYKDTKEKAMGNDIKVMFGNNVIPDNTLSEDLIGQIKKLTISSIENCIAKHELELRELINENITKEDESKTPAKDNVNTTDVYPDSIQKLISPKTNKSDMSMDEKVNYVENALRNGKTAKEISTELGCCSATVYRLIDRVRKKNKKNK